MRYVILALLISILLLTGCLQPSYDSSSTAVRESSDRIEALETVIDALQIKADLLDEIIVGYDARPVDKSDHVFKAIGNDRYLFMHFDSVVDKAKHVKYIGQLEPGNFCLETQQALPEGFVHFFKHDLSQNISAGDTGYWAKHVAVRSFDSAWGPVSPGIDFNYKPHSPPACAGIV